MASKSSSFMIENLLAKSPLKRSSCSYGEEENDFKKQRFSENENNYAKIYAAFYAAAVNMSNQPKIVLNTSSGYSSCSSSFMASPDTSRSSTVRQPLGEITNQHNDDFKVRQRREKKEWICDTCDKVFDRPSLLTRHIRTHTGEKPHVCDLCDKAFSTSSSLNTHRRIHSGEKPHACNVCGKTFTASSNLYYHKLTHTTDKPHKCQQCSKSFATPGDLRCHMHLHNGTWPFRCEICSRGFSKQTNLKNHMLIHSGKILKDFFFEQLLIFFFFLILGAKPFNCDKCDKQFSLSCNLKSHIKTHHGMFRFFILLLLFLKFGILYLKKKS
jgi:uncharacterized Zn-finger protein